MSTHTSPHLSVQASRRRAARRRGELIFRMLGLLALGVEAPALSRFVMALLRAGAGGGGGEGQK